MANSSTTTTQAESSACDYPLPSALSTFSGLGGIDLGLEAAGYRLVGAIKLDELARDPVNCLLSYAYALLTKDLTAVAIAVAVGFDPYLGVLHRPRFGRPALALDLAEEFRPLVAESVVINVITRWHDDGSPTRSRVPGSAS